MVALRSFPIVILLLVLIVTAVASDEPSGPSRVILALGDSLTAGYGLAAADTFPARLETSLRSRGHTVRVVNAGVSGDTTAGGLARLEWSLSESPDLVIVELGANDALRGLDPGQTYANLDAILKRLKAAGCAVILAGMSAPRSLGEDYYSRFDRIYPDLAERHDVILYPFFLEGVAMRPEFNQPDGLHPNASGVDVIVRNILPYVEKLL